MTIPFEYVKKRLLGKVMRNLLLNSKMLIDYAHLVSVWIALKQRARLRWCILLKKCESYGTVHRLTKVI